MNHRLPAALVCSVAALVVGLAPAGVAQATAAKAPAVSGLSFAYSRTAGGALLTVRGVGFAPGATVSFGTEPGRAVTVDSSTALTVRVPGHAAGSVDVRVTTRSGTSRGHAADRLSYVAAPHVTSVAPGAATPAGAVRVTIRGSNFRSIRTVRFGTTTASSVTVVSAGEITATAPAHAAGLVDVQVVGTYGTSPKVAADRFTYEAAPAPVTDLTILDSTRTTVTLAWQFTRTDASHIVVRRADGSTAPRTPSAGTLVATLPAASTAWTDSGVVAGRTYSYSLFAATALGPIYSEGDDLTATVPTRSRPDTPTDVTMTPNPVGGAADCGSQPYGLVPATDHLGMTADVVDPDGGSVWAQFRLYDLGSSGSDSPVTVIGPDSAAGETDPVSGSGTVSLSIDTSTLTPNDVYETDAVADNGRAESASTEPCYFVYSPTRPQSPTVTPQQNSYRVDTPATFTITDTDLGTPPIDHFDWTLGSADDLDDDGGTHVAVTRDTTDDSDSASITFSPSTWGEQFLYVQAVDSAGDVGPVTTVSFYVADN